MRLIDADKLIKDIKELWDYKTVDGITAATVLKQTITDIENQPTVEAIPIEWIEEWGWKNGMSESMSLRVMIDDWEKENETTGKN